MRNIIVCILLSIPCVTLAQPCNIINASGCSCSDGTDTCYLLPDITVSWLAILTQDGGPYEYAQSGNGVNNGRLRFSVSTPNIGYGPLTVRGTDYYICGTDTFIDTTATIFCPGGGDPTNILIQRIYKKENGSMTYQDHFTGGQTYHPGHAHNHVDDWAILTLRMEDPNEPDTLKWPIIGTGSKLGFCLMDFGNCDDYSGHCRDRQIYNSGVALANNDLPNYGLGGGNYNCSRIEQGISVGHTDIYRKSLPEMWIDIPPNTCNGNYWIVVEVDFKNHFIESNENNNWTAIPFALTKQIPFGQAVAEISSIDTPVICNSSPVILETNLASSYQWSTGDTTQSISVTSPGAYFVAIQSQCGSAISDTLIVFEVQSTVTSTIPDTSCGGDSLVLQATGTGNLQWYDAVGNLLHSGTVFSTPFITSSTTYYVRNTITGFGCTMDTPVTAVILDTPDVYFSGLDTIYELSDPAVPLVGHPAKGIFSGPGIDSSSFSPADAGIGVHKIVYYFNNELGCYNADTQKITIIPDLPIADAGKDTAICAGDSIGLTVSGGKNYLWNTGDTTAFITVKPDSSVVYFVQAFNDFGDKDTDSVWVVVYENPVVSFSGLDSIYTTNDTPAILTGYPSGGLFSGSGVESSSFDPAEAGAGGPYEIVYSYTDMNGCTGAYADFVTVVYDSTTLNLNDVPLKDFFIYPNPTNGSINIISTPSQAAQGTLTIYNTLGQKVVNRIINLRTGQKISSLDLSHLSQGIYLVELTFGHSRFIIKIVRD